MALDKAVDSAQLNADLTAVADAIRTKGGTSAQLAFPDGFVSAVQAIEGAPDLQIVVTTSADATVTATKGSKTVSGTADASGHCTLVVDESGTWSITATAGGYSDTADVVVGTNSLELYPMPALDPVFANNDWAAIIAACRSSTVPDTWAVGDSTTMLINGVNYQIDIIGKNHDTYTAGGKAPLTLQLHDCYADQKAMNSSNTNSGGWTSCAMRSTHLPDILALMPTEVQNGIREVNKLTSAGSQISTIHTTADKLFLLSEVEIFGSAASSSAAGEGTQYDYYKAGNSKVKKWNGSAYYWWQRSPIVRTNNRFCLVSTTGEVDYDDANYGRGVAFGFCF